MEYIVRSAARRPDLKGAWNSLEWRRVQALELSFFRPEGSSHRPQTTVKLLHDPEGLYGMFRVQDQFIRCRHSGFQSLVYQDSCVEFFVMPKPHKGYFNFEFNCGGSLLCGVIRDPARTASGFRNYILLTEEDGRQVIRHHSLPRIVDTEISRPETWFLSFFIPFSLIEKYTGTLGAVRGQTWRANFYKCGDRTSHPHWASWTPLPEKNFHLPECFGTLRFA